MNSYKVEFIKTYFSDFYGITIFILYRDFRLCYLNPLLERKKIGSS